MTMTQTFELADHLDDLTAMIRTASERSLQWFRQPASARPDVDNKHDDGGYDPVTIADRAVEDEIRAELTRRFPDHEILGEEGGLSGAGSSESTFRWVIDPIDGTRAFISGQPMWGTLVGLQRGDTVVAGWLHQPTLHETYVASDAGAWREVDGVRRPLQTSATTELGEAILLCTHPSMFVTEAERSAFARVADASRLTRYSGDCVNYALVASGDADLVVENQLQPYDVIPLIPLIERAGGVITDRDGRPPVNGGWAVAAATPGLHQAALDALRG